MPLGYAVLLMALIVLGFGLVTAAISNRPQSRHHTPAAPRSFGSGS